MCGLSGQFEEDQFKSTLGVCDCFQDSSTSRQRKSLKRKLSSSEDERSDRKTKITEDLRNRETDDEDDNPNASIRSRALISSSDSESSDIDRIGAKSANIHKGLTTVASSDDDDENGGIKQSETVKRKLDFCTEKKETENTSGDHDDGYDDDEQEQSGDDDDEDDDVCLASQSNFRSPRAALMQLRRDRQRKKFAKLLETRKRQNHD